MTRKLRIAFLDGPGDAIESFRHWRAGRDNPANTHVPFSRQFYDVAAELDATVLVLSECSRLERVIDGQFTIEHRGNASIASRGAKYHLSEFGQAATTLWAVIRFKPDVIICGERPYAFLLHILRPLGIKIVINLHCVLWRKYAPISRIQRLLNHLNASIYRHHCSAIACVSKDIKRQIKEIAGEDSGPFVDFLPWFREETFANIPNPVFSNKPFTVMFAGRLEPNKGIFGLLNIAHQLEESGNRNLVFEICGNGSVLEELRAYVEMNNLGSRFIIHGYCNLPQMQEVFGRSHLVIVPTTSDFVEGFNMVVVESLLAGRPVISSSVCPAVEYVSDAVISVPPDDWAAYERALFMLSDDSETYESLQRRSVDAGRKFINEETSYKRALLHILENIRTGRSVPAREIDPNVTCIPELV